MKKIAYYIILTLSFLLMIPYIIIAIIIELYFRLAVAVLGRMARPVKGAAPLPRWMKKVFDFVDRMQTYQ